MKYVSTRGQSPAVSLSDAILLGLAPDRGLYVPEKTARPERARPAGPSLRATAQWILEPFFAGDRLAPHLGAILEEAFTFDAPLVITPVSGVSILELFHGPTAAFKDFGARFLAACFRRLGGKATVLVATSGDTGSAVGAAFHGQPGVRVAILYPEGRVAPRQAHQLGCFGDNVHALVVKGTFDTCQTMVKKALGDATLRANAPLASANSISLGRMLPQMAYYAHAALQRPGLSFAVPTGNLGNAFACLLARAAGAPIGDVLLATNSNRGLADYLGGITWSRRPTIATVANAMDVGDPSNFERLTWLQGTGKPPVIADWVDDETIRARIRESEARYGQVVCPHTACAIEAVERRRRAKDNRPWAVVATAHPSKFETVVEPLVGHAVPPPPALAEMLARPSHAEPLAATDAALKEWLLRP